MQGVGFRYFVERTAKGLGLDGWVRNCDDGTVEVYARGSEPQLSNLEGFLWKGPSMSEVRGVESREAAPEDTRGFSIRR